MQDEPSLTNRARRWRGHIATAFRLDDGFIAAFGEPKARRTLEVLTHVAAEYAGRRREDIRSRLRVRLRAIGVHLSEAQIDSVAGQISGSDETARIGEPHPRAARRPRGRGSRTIP